MIRKMRLLSSHSSGLFCLVLGFTSLLQVTQSHAYEPDRVLPTVSFSYVELKVRENKFGSVSFEDKTVVISCAPVKRKILSRSSNEIRFDEFYAGTHCPKKLSFVFTSIDTERYSLKVETFDFAPVPLGLHPQLRVTLKRNKSEKILGFGEQFTFTQWQNRSIWTVVQEQGTGRGDQPITSIVRALASPSEGDATSTYAPSPYFLSSANYAFLLKNKEPAHFQFEEKGQSQIDVLAHNLEAEIQFGRGLKDLLKIRQRTIGRAPRLPDWIHSGVIAGGFVKGEQNLDRMLTVLEQDKIPTAAVFIEDWCGYRQTLSGKRLWWHWELDQTLYPNWSEYRSRMKASGIKIMGYFNPLLANPISKWPVERNHYLEALEGGYYIKSASGGVQEHDMGGLIGTMVDLTNDNAYAWLKAIMIDQGKKLGFDLWLADFGEAVAVDSQLEGGTGMAQKNNYVELWSKLNREVASELGPQTTFAMRAGYLDSARYANLHWMGDQNASFGRYDGLGSTLTAFLTGGLSGILINHSDTAGILNIPVPGLRLRRTHELYFRWMEMNAFSPIFRTKEGFGFSGPMRIFEEAPLRSALGYWSKVFASMHSYRSKLMDEAYENGVPVVRPMLLEYPDIEKSWEIQTQYLLGPDLLVAPIIGAGIGKKDVFLPAGRWTHLWTGQVHDHVGSSYKTISVDAPIGRPPVFIRSLGEITNPNLSELMASIPLILKEIGNLTAQKTAL